MFGWLRDTLANTSPSLSYRHSMIPSRFFPQQQKNHKKKDLSSSSNDDDDDETDEETNGNSFYHNPYHSSGQMNYADVPQQQYINEHTYPTYLARQQISEPTTQQSLDEQIHAKLLSLQQRGHPHGFHVDKQQNSSYRNQPLQTSQLSFVPNLIKENIDTNNEDEVNEEKTDGDNDDEMRVYYPGHYPNQDEQFDLASVVLWYRNVMQSVKKFM